MIAVEGAAMAYFIVPLQTLSKPLQFDMQGQGAIHADCGDSERRQRGRD